MQGLVFPAQAGMSPTARGRSGGRTSVPRASGDEPVAGHVTLGLPEVFPAQAGMGLFAASGITWAIGIVCSFYRDAK